MQMMHKVPVDGWCWRWSPTRWSPESASSSPGKILVTYNVWMLLLLLLVLYDLPARRPELFRRCSTALPTRWCALARAASGLAKLSHTHTHTLVGESLSWIHSLTHSLTRWLERHKQTMRGIQWNNQSIQWVLQWGAAAVMMMVVVVVLLLVLTVVVQL